MIASTETTIANRQASIDVLTGDGNSQSGIDPLKDQLIPFAAVADMFGMRPYSIHKWGRKGLKSIVYGGYRQTTMRAIREFLSTKDPLTCKAAAMLLLADRQLAETAKQKG